MLKGDTWEGYIKPSEIFGNLYFVGTRPASTHIIDTGDGLMLIDPGYQESLYLVINNIWQVGLNPKDIKYILLTHCHYDHVDATKALVKLTGAKVYFPALDLPLYNGEIFHYPFKPFDIDVLINDGDIFTFGNTTVKCVSTPGHTDGTTSYFFDVTDGKDICRAGMHGGVGYNTLKSDFLKANSLSGDCRQKYIYGLDKVLNEKVDITLGNHVGQNNTEGKLARLGLEDKNPFIDPAEWQRFIANCKNGMLELIESDPY